MVADTGVASQIVIIYADAARTWLHAAAEVVDTTGPTRAQMAQSIASG